MRNLALIIGGLTLVVIWVYGLAKIFQDAMERPEQEPPEDETKPKRKRGA